MIDWGRDAVCNTSYHGSKLTCQYASLLHPHRTPHTCNSPSKQLAVYTVNSLMENERRLSLWLCFKRRKEYWPSWNSNKKNHTWIDISVLYRLSYRCSSISYICKMNEVYCYNVSKAIRVLASLMMDINALLGNVCFVWHSLMVVL